MDSRGCVYIGLVTSSEGVSNSVSKLSTIRRTSSVTILTTFGADRSDRTDSMMAPLCIARSWLCSSLSAQTRNRPMRGEGDCTDSLTKRLICGSINDS